MKLNVDEIKNFAVEMNELQQNPDKHKYLHGVLYLCDNYPLLCKIHVGYTSKISGPEDAKKNMAYFYAICYLPNNWSEKIPKFIGLLFNLHPEFTTSLTVRILKTRNDNVCKMDPDIIKPIEDYNGKSYKVSIYETYDEAEFEYSDFILNKKPES